MQTINTQIKAEANKVDKRIKLLDITMKRNHYRQDALIEILHKAQESFGYLEPDVLEYIEPIWDLCHLRRSPTSLTLIEQSIDLF
jgi:NADH:ubiquinone oxidoreductase subunit E